MYIRIRILVMSCLSLILPLLVGTTLSCVTKKHNPPVETMIKLYIFSFLHSIVSINSGLPLITSVSSKYMTMI